MRKMNMIKMKMELVWHNCKTHVPSESYNRRLVVTNGAEVHDVTWLSDSGYIGNSFVIRPGDPDSEAWWWADLDRTVAGFFRGA